MLTRRRSDATGYLNSVAPLRRRARNFFYADDDG